MDAFTLADASVDTRIRRRLVHSSIDLSGKKVLDVGCGIGVYSKDLLDKEIEVFGVDAQRELVDKATSKLGGYFTVSLAESLPFKKKSFDAILLTDVLEHVEDPKKVLLELLEALRIDGVLVITVPGENMQKIYNVLNMDKTEHGHQRLYSVNSLVSEVGQIEFGEVGRIEFGSKKKLLKGDASIGFSEIEVRKIQSPITGLVGMLVAKLALRGYGKKAVEDCQMTVKAEKNPLLSSLYLIGARILYPICVFFEVVLPTNWGTEVFGVFQKRKGDDND